VTVLKPTDHPYHQPVNTTFSYSDGRSVLQERLAFSMVTRSRNSCVGFALWGLLLLLSVVPSSRAHAATFGVIVTTNHGCGPNAVFQDGEGTAFDFSVARDSLVTLHLQRPDITLELLNNFSARAGFVYRVSGVAGVPFGPRTVTVFATAGSDTGQASCSYSVVPKAQDSSIAVTLSTDRGCGTSAVYQSGETVNISYSTNRNAFVVLKLVGPNGTQTLKDNVVATAGQTYTVPVTAGAGGSYQIILDAGADGRTGHAECGYRVDSATIALTLSTNRGCGDNALFHTGEPVNISFATDRTAFVVLKLVGPGGTQTLKNNDVANAGQTYPVTVTAGAAGSYQLILDAVADGRSGHIECAFRVEAASQIGVTLTTNKGCGTDAVFRTGDAVNITYSTDQNAFVVLKLVGPNGTQTLKNNDVANAGQSYPVTVTAGAPGNYQLILDAGAEGRTGHIECAFRVDSAAQQIGVNVVTNKGCGTDAVFHPFEAMFFDFAVSQPSLVRFQIEMIGGGTQVLLNNFVAQPGVLYRLHTAFSAVGNFRVRVNAAANSATGEDTCELFVRN